ncbi:MAG: hypothetical protein LBT48_04800, partial [Prevotellaceae bacterium]|nr:hypothetical protein [Prevotellaceae bacterium]
KIDQNDAMNKISGGGVIRAKGGESKSNKIDQNDAMKKISGEGVCNPCAPYTHVIPCLTRNLPKQGIGGLSGDGGSSPP